MEIKGLIDQFKLYNPNKVQENKKDILQKEKKEIGLEEDKVELSSGAKMLKDIINDAKGSSEIREEKVTRLKLQIEEGTYSPDPKKIASKIMENEIDLFL